MKRESIFADLADDVLLSRLAAAVVAHHRIEAELLALIGEVDRRKLYLEVGCSSMFAYAVEVLHLSESGAYKRITAARAGRRFPRILSMVEAGEIHLTATGLLAPYLDESNADHLLASAIHKTKRQVEEVIAARFPKPDTAAVIRKLPTPTIATRRLDVACSQPAELAVEPAGRDQLALERANTPSVALPRQLPTQPALMPLSAERYKVQFTATRALREKMERARGLLSHQLPSGDLASMVELAFDALIEKEERRKLAKVSRTNSAPIPIGKAPEAPPDVAPTSRHIPNRIRREVYERDGGQCTYVASDGKRCSATAFLELHHIAPFAKGGHHALENIRVVCRAHNGFFAERDYGVEHMRRFQAHILRISKNHPSAGLVVR
jgi:hypothetical protein